MAGIYRDASGREVYLPGGPQTAPQETFTLATGNTAAAPATVYGGDYIFTQQAGAYGTIALQVLGPDGTTYQTIVSKTASDSGSGTALSLGSYAKVQVALSGTTGAVAILSRVPA